MMAGRHQARELILHLGLAKTGTSALQKALVAGKARLYDRYRVLYPGDEESHALLQACFSSQPTSSIYLQLRGITEEARALAYLRDYRRRLVEEIDAKRPRRIIISSEYFSALGVTGLRRLVAFLSPLAMKLTPVAYVRDPWSFSISLIQELIRGGKLDDRVEIGYAATNELFERFEAVFGMPIQVVPYGNVPGFDIVSDFLGRLGISPQAASMPPTGRSNQGMSREAAVALLQCNRLFPVHGPDGQYIRDAARDWMIQNIVDAPFPGTRIGLSEERARAILEESRDDLEQLEFKYFGGAPVFSGQFSQMATASEGGRLCPEAVDQASIYAHMLQAMHGLSTFAAHQFTERIYWTGRYQLAVGDEAGARRSFQELADFPGPHVRRDEAQARLAAWIQADNAAPPAGVSAVG